MPQAKASCLLAAGGQQQDEAVQCQVGLAAAQIIGPDESEAQDCIDVETVGARSDGGPGRCALTDQRSGVGWRETFFQIWFCAELRNLMRRELPAEESAQLLTEFQAGAMQVDAVAFGSGEIDELQLSCFL